MFARTQCFLSSWRGRERDGPITFLLRFVGNETSTRRVPKCIPMRRSKCPRRGTRTTRFPRISRLKWMQPRPPSPCTSTRRDRESAPWSTEWPMAFASEVALPIRVEMENPLECLDPSARVHRPNRRCSVELGSSVGHVHDGDASIGVFFGNSLAANALKSISCVGVASDRIVTVIASGSTIATDPTRL